MTRFSSLSIAVAIFALPGHADPAPPESRPQPELAAKPKSFTVFDNMGRRGKPDTRVIGMKPCLVIYIDGGAKSFQLPDEKAYKEMVHNFAGRKASISVKGDMGHEPNPEDKGPGVGPIVLDCEGPTLSGSREVVEKHFKMFMDLVKWTHEAAPGRPVGYYGHGLFPEAVGGPYMAEAKKLAGAVDAFFPSMYSFDTDGAKWEKHLKGLVSKANELAPGKPVYAYMWDHFHAGGSRRGEVPAKYLCEQLQRAKACGADGAVFWSGAGQWGDKNPEWWDGVAKFIAQSPASAVVAPVK